MTATKVRTSTAARSPRMAASPDSSGHQTVGGIAAFYLAVALLAAIPYFLLVIDYPAAETAAAKVDLITGNYASMYVMYLAAYVAFGLAVGLLALVLRDRLHGQAPSTVRMATFVGLLWSAALVASGMVFTHGMTVIHSLAATDRAAAVTAWQALEPVALALGGAGGEILGGLWILLLSLVVVRRGGLPRPMGWLGVIIGAAGIVSVVPALADAAVAFGLLEIAWFAWLGGLLLMGRSTPGSDHALDAAI